VREEAQQHQEHRFVGDIEVWMCHEIILVWSVSFRCYPNGRQDRTPFGHGFCFVAPVGSWIRKCVTKETLRS
jgi:hypothetical protein